jgi:hypothetical protein
LLRERNMFTTHNNFPGPTATSRLHASAPSPASNAYPVAHAAIPREASRGVFPLLSSPARRDPHYRLPHHRAVRLLIIRCDRESYSSLTTIFQPTPLLDRGASLSLPMLPVMACLAHLRCHTSPPCPGWHHHHPEWLLVPHSLPCPLSIGSSGGPERRLHAVHVAKQRGSSPLSTPVQALWIFHPLFHHDALPHWPNEPSSRASLCSRDNWTGQPPPPHAHRSPQLHTWGTSGEAPGNNATTATLPTAHPQDWPCTKCSLFELSLPCHSSLCVHLPTHFPTLMSHCLGDPFALPRCTPIVGNHLGTSQAPHYSSARLPVRNLPPFRAHFALAYPFFLCTSGPASPLFASHPQRGRRDDRRPGHRSPSSFPGHLLIGFAPLETAACRRLSRHGYCGDHLPRRSSTTRSKVPTH